MSSLCKYSLNPFDSSTMYDVDIAIKGKSLHFSVGDTVSGVAHFNLPEDVPLANVTVSFHCRGEVKWIEYPGSPYYMNGYVYYDQIDYHDEMAKWNEKDVKLEKNLDTTKVEIPFSFIIPVDKCLPSTMCSIHGFIKYFVRVSIKNPAHEDLKRVIKEIIVQSPLKENLMITVGGSAEKSVLLHNGKVSMSASIGRKGFYPGESINVHVTVENGTNTKVTPRVSLHQVQIFMCGSRHKTIESNLSNEANLSDEGVVGMEIGAHSSAEELLLLKIPSTESLTIKSSVITVKYFVRCTLDIPNAFDLHINLPVVLTSKKVIEEIGESAHNGDSPLIAAW